jgi:predicted dehydrogenase
MQKTALVGLGYWGKNIFRNLINMIGVHNVVIIDKQEHILSDIKSKFPSLEVFNHIDGIISRKDIINVIIATPTHTHYSLAKKMIQARKNILIEKPTTTSLKEALQLHVESKKNNVLIMTDYIFLYHPVVNTIKELIKRGKVGKIKHIDSTRINLGIYQKETNVLWDLACHDISIVNYFIDEKPTHIRAIGRLNMEFLVEDISYIFLYYKSGLLVQINSSWASPVKIRKMIIGAEKSMLIYDDLNPLDKLKVYDYCKSNVKETTKNELTEYRLGKITSPKIDNTEPLKLVLADFFESSQNKSKPKITYESTIDIIKYLEKAHESIKLNGELVEI